MKFRVSMKCSDALDESIREAVEVEVANLPLDEEERESVAESRQKKIRDICGKWFEYGEYLEVDVDTEAGTCIVVNQK